MRFDSERCANGTKRGGDSVKAQTEQRIGTSTGGEFDVTFDTLCGGELVVEVSTEVGARSLTVKTRHVYVQGTNPSNDELKQAVAEPVVGRILRFESQLRQFVTTDSVGGALYPLFSGDRLLGAGLGQITPCPVSAVWNWRKNVEAANAKFRDARRAATGFPARCRNSADFKTRVAEWNRARVEAKLPPLPVTLPDFTPQQIERDAVRCYNGAAGTDRLTGGALHEYRVAMVGDVLDVAIQPGGTAACAKWEEVPVSDRPSSSGDPDYVNHVYNCAEL